MAQKAKKLTGVQFKIQRIQRSLDAMEVGRYAEFDIHYICDYLSWLAKFNKVPREVWVPLVEQATRILESGVCLLF